MEAIELFEKTPLEKRWAFGRNRYSAELSKIGLIAGFIDDFYPHPQWHDLPVVRSNEIEDDIFIIIASGGNTLSIKKKLEKGKIKHIDYFAFQKKSGYELPEIYFNEGFENHFKSNISKFDNTYYVLKDEESKTIYKKLIKFRLTHDIRYLNGFKENQENQYFDFLSYIEDKLSNFIDIGAYHGENSITFAKENPDYSNIIAIEPNSENFEFCVNQTSSLPNIRVINGVLGRTEGIVEFDGQGTTGFIVESGGLRVQMQTLDSVCGEISGTTVIKMDVEGGEEEIILGGRNALQELRPILAISGYHRIQDYWKIPELVFSVLNNYSLYIRHYTETIYETVLYFIPNETNLRLP